LQYFHKTHKTPEKHRKTLENTKNSQYARVLREFSKSKKIRLYCTKHFSQNICKTPQNSPPNTAKQSQNAFCEITSQNTAQRTQNARKRHKTLTIQPQCVLRACIRCFLPKYARSVAKAYNTQYTRKLRRGGHVPAGGHVAGLWMFFKNRKQCFAVFCGILRCFAVFYVRVFSVFHETAQNRPTSNKYTKRTKRTKYALCNTAQYGAVHLLLTQKICLQKNIRKTRPKHCKNPQNTAKHCFSKNTRKTPQNSRKTPTKHRKTPQNTTKHICLLTKQTEY